MLDFLKSGASLRRRYPRLPPGPSGIPIAGMMPFLIRDTHLRLHELAKQHGDIMAFKLGEVPVVVISHPDLLAEAFVMPELSDRWLPETCKLFFRGGKAFGFSAYDERWVRFSRIFNKNMFNPRRVGQLFAEHMVPQVQTLLEEIDDGIDRGSTFHPQEAISSANSRLTFRTVFGNDAGQLGTDERDELIECINYFFRNVTKPNPRDYFSWLRHMPLPLITGITQQVKVRDRIVTDLIDRAARREGIDLGNPAILVEVMLARAAEGEMTREDILLMVGDLFLAAVDTTALTTAWLLLHLANRPALLARVHVELDEIVGADAPPEQHERSELPLLDSVLRESMRFLTIAPLGVPHKARVDVELGGYTIPKDTQVLGSLHAIHHDARFWSDPDTFVPERFIPDADGKLPGVLHPSAWLPFGVGRRGCPGERLGLRLIWLTVTRLLQRYTFTLAPGTPSPAPEDGILGLTQQPRPFSLRMQRRHPQGQPVPPGAR